MSVHAIRRRAGRRKPFEVRWRAAGRSRSKSFTTRKLADSYRAELVRAARAGLDLDPQTGEPAAWNLPEPAVVTWYQQATAYTVMKWPSLAAHSRASLADALAAVTPALTRPGVRNRPGPQELRTALYRHAFNPARPAGAGSPAAQILDWKQQASLPVGCLNQQIDHVLKPFPGPGPCPSVESQRCAPTAQLRRSQRLRRPRDGHTTTADAVRYTSVTSPPGPPTAHKPRRPQAIAATLSTNV